MKSDESALSIVPSRMSSRLSSSTSQASRRQSIRTYTSIVYHRLSFEDELFTATVYKRNYRNTRLQRQRKKDSKLDHETNTPPQGGLQHNKELVKLRLHRFSYARTDTDISARTAEQHAEEIAEYPVPGTIMVFTSYGDVSSVEEIDQDLEHRVGSSASGRDGLYVKLTGSLEHRINPSASASYVQLVMACGRGDNEAVKRQLATMPASIESPEIPALLGSYISGSFYFCPIHAAVFGEHVEVMRTLLERAKMENDLGRVLEKAIGGTEIDRWLPLHVATLKGNLVMVKLLLDNGASVLSRTGHGIQAAHLAARIGAVDIFDALIDAGADPNCMDLDERTPLNYFASSDSTLYIQKRDARSDGSTAPRLPVEDYLTSDEKARRPDKNLPDQRLQLLNTAVKYGSPSRVEMFIKDGIDPTAVVIMGALVFTRFCQGTVPPPNTMKQHKRILKLLLDKINLLALNRYRNTIFDSVFQSAIRPRRLTKTKIARLVLHNLPSHKFLKRFYVFNYRDSKEAKSTLAS